ncbi:MAG: hypothetical protein D3920_04160 [Candidatus Electrothrix sp. AW2]|nr:hypothetical protein [Candidatus Electrothrix gigas]
MGETLQELEKIRYYYCSGDYTKTYEALVKLCCDNPECENFLDKAERILSRYNRIKRKVDLGCLALSDAFIEENKISFSYDELIQKMEDFFKKDFDKEKKRISHCEKCILYTKKKCAELKIIRHEVEEEFQFCENDNEKNIMMDILRHINDTIICFLDMNSNFTTSNSYESQQVFYRRS